MKQKDGRLEHEHIWAGYGVPIVLLIVAEIFYFRNVIGTPWMMGDFGDGRFCNLAVEHWYQVFIGKVHWTNLGMFFPAAHTIAYSDMFIGFAPLYILFRSLGMDMFTANKCVLILFHVFGTLSMFYMLKHTFHFRALPAMVGSIVFAYANVMNLSLHTQLYAIYMVPLFVILMAGYFQNVSGSGKTRYLYFWGALAQFAVIFYTAGYIGYFLAMFLGVFVVVYCILKIAVHAHPLFKIFQFISRHVFECVSYLLGVAIFFYPFIHLYLPISTMFGKRNWIEIADFLPTLKDFITIYPTNWLYGHFGKYLLAGNGAGELVNGYPWITLLLFILGTIYLIFWMIRGTHHPHKSRAVSPQNRVTDEMSVQFAVTAALSVGICWILILKVGKDFSLWYLIYKLVPGIGEIRAVSRFNLLLVFPVAFVVACFIDQVLMKLCCKSEIRRLVLGMPFLLVFVEYIWTGGVIAAWNADDMRHMLAKTSAPPSDCQVMYIMEDYQKIPSTGYTPYQLDAWMIAMHYGISTINGYSSNYPLGWLSINNMSDPAYGSAVNQWIHSFSLQHVYEYDLTDRVWIKVSSNSD